MTRKKQQPEVSVVRSSAAEYLTFVAATGSQEQAVEMRYEDENIWLSQKMMATLYDVTVPAINQHLKRIFADRELTPDAVIKQLLTTAAVSAVTLAREAAPAFNSPAPVAHSAPTCAPLPAIAPTPRTGAFAAPRANVGALARDSAPAFNSPGPETPSAGQLNAGSESSEKLTSVNRALRKSPPGGRENAA